MEAEFRRSLEDVEHFVYDTVLPQLKLVEENQHIEYGDELYDIFHCVMIMSYSAMRHRGWTTEEIRDTLEKVEEHNEFEG